MSSPSTDYALILNADGTTPYYVSVWKLVDSGGTATPVKVGYLSWKAYSVSQFYYATIEPNSPTPVVFLSKSGVIQSDSSDPFMLGMAVDGVTQWMYSGVDYVEFSTWLDSDSAQQILDDTTAGSSNQAYIWTFYYTNTPNLSTAGTPVYLTYGYLPGLYFGSSSPMIGLPNDDGYLPVEASSTSVQDLLIFMVEPKNAYSICYSADNCASINFSEDWICGPLGGGSYCLGPDTSGSITVPIAPNCTVCQENPPPPPPPPPPLPGADTVWSYINWQVLGIAIGVTVGAILLIAVAISIVRAKNHKEQEALESSSSSTNK